MIGWLFGTLGDVWVLLCGCRCCWKMSAIVCMADSWSWPMCAYGVDGLGLRSTWMRSVVAWIATSVGVRYGTGVCCGKNSTVSELRSDLVWLANTR